MGGVNLCVIDDCRDADVPLLEVTAGQLLLRHSTASGRGHVTCQFSVEYYNRVLSGWEPFVEPFKCLAKWHCPTPTTPTPTTPTTSTHSFRDANRSAAFTNQEFRCHRNFHSSM